MIFGLAICSDEAPAYKIYIIYLTITFTMVCTPCIKRSLIYDHFEEFSGMTQLRGKGPRRTVVPQREGSKSSAFVDSQSQGLVSTGQDLTVKDSVMQLKNMATVIKETQEDASITPPSLSGTITKIFDENLNPFDVQRDQIKSNTGCKDCNPMPLLHSESQHIDGQKKVQFAIASNATSQGNICSILFLIFNFYY